MDEKADIELTQQECTQLCELVDSAIQQIQRALDHKEEEDLKENLIWFQNLYDKLWKASGVDG